MLKPDWSIQILGGPPICKARGGVMHNCHGVSGRVQVYMTDTLFIICFMKSARDHDWEIEKVYISFSFSLCFSHVKFKFRLGYKSWLVGRSAYLRICL